MSDSINSEATEAFNAIQHIQETCKGSSIKFAEYIPISYRIGWVDLVKEMLIAMKDTGVLVTSISSDYGQLDVQFESCKKVHELKVWRAINVARINSTMTCMDCGDAGYRHTYEGNVVVLCRGCIGKITACGKTGTWLDRY